MLAVNFLEYRNWKTTREASLEYIKTVLSSVPLEMNPVQAFTLRYIDRYTFDGPPHEPNARMLFQDGNAYMTPRCFESGAVWHCNSGWFELRDGGNRILNQLKVSSAAVDGVSTSTIDHNAILAIESAATDNRVAFWAVFRWEYTLRRRVESPS